MAQNNTKAAKTKAAKLGRAIPNGVIRDLLRAAFHANVIVLASATLDVKNRKLFVGMRMQGNYLQTIALPGTTIALGISSRHALGGT